MISTKNKEEKQKCNAWVLRPDKVGFEVVDEPKGLQYLFFNDGQRYFKLIEKDGELVPFILPDSDPKEMFYDPKEYAQAKKMECNRKYFAWKDDMFQKISLGIMAVIIFAEVIGFALVG